MFELPQLPFEKIALGDWTSAETIDYHYGKHHAGYVKKLNAAVEGTELGGKELPEVIAVARGENPKVFNASAQHFNHSFFWNCLIGESNGPEGALLEAINKDFGSVNALKEKFTALAAGHFGSGWVWLLQENDALVLRDFHDADTPADGTATPLLTLDVWEHAYYIDHRNNRDAFIEGFWAHVNWTWVASQIQ